HPGEALHGLTRQGTHQRLVAVHQRLHQQVGHLLGRQRVHRPTGRTLALALAHLLLHVAPHLVELVVALDDAVLGTTQAEVHLEHRLEGPPVCVVLHHGRAERVLERLAVLDGDVLHGLHRVEVLGQRHRQTGVAQLGDEAGQQAQHSFSTRALGPPCSTTRNAKEDLYGTQAASTRGASTSSLSGSFSNSLPIQIGTTWPRAKTRPRITRTTRATRALDSRLLRDCSVTTCAVAAVLAY